MDRHLREQGYEVQKMVRQMNIFKLDPAFYTIEFERKFQTSDLFSKADVTVTDEQTGDIAIYEIKSSSKVKDEHLVDLAFQKAVAESVGLSVSKTCLITVNGNYVADGELVPDELFTLTDVSDHVEALKIETADGIAQAFEYLDSEPIPSLVDYCGDKLDCKFLQKHFPELPEYTVFQVSRLDDKKRKELLTNDIVDIRHIPADFKLTDIQRKQVDVACSGEPYIDNDAIRSELGNLEFPLHFLDYETFGYAIPKFPGMRPFQAMVFQYSLHTLSGAGVEPVHSGHLTGNDGIHPAREIVERLYNSMAGNIGTVISWNASFESTRNKELCLMYPESAAFLEEVNARMYDLETIFKKQMYVHPEFLGKTSIKNVLPVLVPERTYKDMNICDGNTASILWYHMATGRVDAEEAQQIYNDLCKYCHLDTLAMVEIYNQLKEL